LIWCRDNVNDFRGTIYAQKDVLEDESLLGNLSLLEEVTPQEVSTAYNFIFLDGLQLDGLQKDFLLSRIFFEGSGEYDYTLKSDKGSVDTAITYISPYKSLNIYIENQNRFLQSLISLVNLKNINMDEAYSLFNEKTSIYTGDATEISVDIFSDPDYRDIDYFTGESLLELKNSIEYSASRIVFSDSDTSLILSPSFISGELLNMLCSIHNAGLSKNLNSEIKSAEQNVSYLQGEVGKLNRDVEQSESLLENAKKNYNLTVDLVNEKKQEVDSVYQDYLTRKEIYFYASNVYLAGDNFSEGLETYKNQFLDYKAKQSFNHTLFSALKDIKMQKGEAQNNPELEKLFMNIQKTNYELNDAEEALILLKVFQHYLENKPQNQGTDPTSLESLFRRAYWFNPFKKTSNSSAKIQLGDIRFRRGSRAYRELHKALSENKLLSNEAIEDYIRKLDIFILRKGREIFSDSENLSLGLMVIELESYIEKIKSETNTLLSSTAKKYRQYLNSFINEKLFTYAHYRSKLEEYETELWLTEKQFQHLKTSLTAEQEEKVNEFIKNYKGSWEKLDTLGMEEEIIEALFMEKHKEEFSELIVLYSYLLGELNPETLSEEKESKWGKNLEKLKQKYGVSGKEVVKYEHVINEGIIFNDYDFSESGCMKIEFGRQKDLLDRVMPLDYFNAVSGSNLFASMLSGLKNLYSISLQNQSEIEKYRFDLQIKSLAEEKNRFEQKVSLGMKRGVGEWDGQFLKIRGEYRKWLTEMKTKLKEAEKEWEKREIKYLKLRDSWAGRVMEKIASGEDLDFQKLKHQIEGLTEGVSVGVESMRKNAEKLEKEFITEVMLPQWLSDYEVLANSTFRAVKKKGLDEQEVDKAVTLLRESLESFEKEKQNLEAEKLYLQLKKAQEMILAEIRYVDEANMEMLDQLMEEGGFKKKGSGYEKSVVVDYSLIGGEKKEKVSIGTYSQYIIDQKAFFLPGIEELRNIKDSAGQKVFLLKETEKLQESKKEVLGTKNRVGDIYKKHIGRLPSGDEPERYVREKQEKGLFWKIGEIFREAMKPILWLFGKHNSSEDEEESAFQERLAKAIPYDSNKKLETGRIIMEYQRVFIEEAQVKAKKDRGILNVPLFPGGPSLSSIGNVVMAVLTAGSSAVVSAAAQLGWNTFTTLATHAEGKIGNEEAVLSIFKNAASTGVTGGFSRAGTGISDKLMESSLKEIGFLSSDIQGVVVKSVIDAEKYMIDQSILSAINAVEITGGDRLSFNSSGFGQGFGMGVGGSVGAFGASFISAVYEVGGGATWSGKGYEFNTFLDTKKGENRSF